MGVRVKYRRGMFVWCGYMGVRVKYRRTQEKELFAAVHIVYNEFGRGVL
jgi:hypothetical protein